MSTPTLTKQEVITARQRYLDGRVSISKLADEYGLTKSGMQVVLDCTNWKELLSPGEAEQLRIVRQSRQLKAKRKWKMEHHLKGKSMTERLNDRLKNSGDPSADIVHKAGDGARRTFTNLHPFGFHGETGTNHSTDGRVAENSGAKSQGSGENP